MSNEEFFFEKHLTNAINAHSFGVIMDYPMTGKKSLSDMLNTIQLKPKLLQVIDRAFSITSLEDVLKTQNVTNIDIRQHLIVSLQKENLNRLFPNGMTLLHVYVKYGNTYTQAISNLLNLGINVSIKDHNGNRAEKYAIDQKNYKLAKLIRQMGANTKKEHETKTKQHNHKFAIQFETSDTVLPDIKQKLEFFRQYKADQPIIPWTGMTVIKDMFGEYLMYEYNQVVCETIHMSDNPIQNNIQYESIASCIRNNSDRDIIAFLAIYIEPGRGAGHANALIYRRQFQTIEHFEPYGILGTTFIRPFLNKLQSELSRLLATKITFLSENDICPVRIGIQSYEEQKPTSDGYCLLWSMLILHLVFRFPTIPTKHIISNILRIEEKSKIPQFLSEVIIGYAKYVYSILNNYYGDVMKQYPNINAQTGHLAEELLERQNKEEKELAQNIAILQSYAANKQIDSDTLKIIKQEITDNETKLKELAKQRRTKMKNKMPIKGSFSKSKSKSFDLNNLFTIENEKKQPVVLKPITDIKSKSLPTTKDTFFVENFDFNTPQSSFEKESTPFNESDKQKTLETLKETTPVTKILSPKQQPFAYKLSLQYSPLFPKDPKPTLYQRYSSSLYFPLELETPPQPIRFKKTKTKKSLKPKKTIREMLKTKKTKIVKSMKPVYDRMTKKLKSYFR